jgi:hypothetical protein
MIYTEFLYGQGFGNQLAVYVTTRAIALRNGYEFGYIGLENFGDRRYNDKGVYFMDVNFGAPVEEPGFPIAPNVYKEKETRVKFNHSDHDATLGCDVRLIDQDLLNVKKDTKIMGIMQGEDYFWEYREQVKEWLKVKPEFDCLDYRDDNICVLNIRDYEGDNTLFLSRDYWVRAIYHMLNLNPNMQFLIITENPDMAKRLLPELADNVYHFDLAKDYSIVKNAKWLIISNSSFAYFPAFCSDAHLIIAPKYWARHNVSDGYWACGYNISRKFTYMDRSGMLQSYTDVMREFELYKKETKIYG